MQKRGNTMPNRSTFPIELDQKTLDPSFPVSYQYYTQHYQTDNYLHYHNCMEIGRCLRGSGVQFIEGKIYSFSGNALTLLQKSCVHDSHIIMFDPTEKPSEWQYIFVDLDALGIENQIDQSFLTMERNLRHLYEMMFYELEMKPDGWKDQFLLLMRAFLRLAQRNEPSTKPMKRDPMADQIAAALHIIATDYAQELSVSELANRCNMSVSYFRKLFVTNVGMNPQQYIIHVRLSLAEHLLRTTNKQILSISEEVGFRSLSSFNRQFRKAYGFAPSDLRR